MHTFGNYSLSFSLTSATPVSKSCSLDGFIHEHFIHCKEVQGTNHIRCNSSSAILRNGNTCRKIVVVVPFYWAIHLLIHWLEHHNTKAGFKLALQINPKLNTLSVNYSSVIVLLDQYDSTFPVNNFDPTGSTFLVMKQLDHVFQAEVFLLF